MKIKEWALVLLAGIFTVGCLNYLVREKQEQEEEKEQTKIEAPARIDHSEFEDEGTYTMRALEIGDVVGGKWIRIVVENVVPCYVGIVPVQAHTFINGDCIAFGTMPSNYNLMVGENGSSNGYQLEGEGFETYKGTNYLDIYVEEGSYVVSDYNGTSSYAFTIDESTKVKCFVRGGDVVANDGFAYELIP